jgi:phosphoglucomutase
MPSALDSRILSQIETFKLPSLEQRQLFLKRCVLSASGLRFIHSGDEEDTSTWACDEAQLFVLAAVEAFTRLLKAHKGSRVWLGYDARPTGPLFSSMSAHYFKTAGLSLRVMGCSPIPEIMAATHQSGFDGFCYFTASHNPKGHNGLKLGLADGAVLNRERATDLISELKTSYLNDAAMQNLLSTLKTLAFTPISAEILLKDKAEALRYYETFALQTVAPNQGRNFLEKIASSWGTEQPMFLVDMNGSSRLRSVDIEFIKAMGLRPEVMGGVVGEFQHAIIPEGKSLEPLRLRIQALLDAGECVLGGLAPDCDGDRGNLILVIEGQARILKAQETFALCAVTEYSTHVALGEKRSMALVANGPSSLRLEKILEPYGVEVHRAEVGEANVLALAQKLRNEGYFVPMAGEGSNGGNILYPSTVRDPLMTLLSLLKFIALPLKGGASSARQLLGAAAPSKNTQLLEKVLQQFPHWTSTEAFEGEALMPVPAIDHETLKSRYEQKILAFFEDQEEFWESLGVAELRIVSNDGIWNIPGPGGRPANSKGGLQVFLDDAEGEALGFLWMRGSGTEPVFRVMVDWPGREVDYRGLLNLHRLLIEKCCSE